MSPFLFTRTTKGGADVPIKADTIRNRCLYHMQQAGIDVEKFKAYSIRHASASAMIRKGVPCELVIKIGRWKSLTTFLKYYLRIDLNRMDVIATLTNCDQENSTVCAPTEDQDDEDQDDKDQATVRNRRLCVYWLTK